MVFARGWPLVVDAKFLMPGAPRAASGSASEAHLAVSSSRQFTRHQRLISPAEFTRVLSRPDGQLRAGPLRVLWKKNDMQLARLGLIVGKRAAAKAVERNRIKRVIREQFRQRQGELAGSDVVVQAFGSANNAKLTELLARGFAQAGKPR